jgi:outer membrane immunogenic protein
MKSKILIAMLAGALSLATTASIAAERGNSYVGLQYAYGSYDEDGISETFYPSSLIARLGNTFHPNFAVEARLGFGLQDDTQFVSSLGPSGIDARFEIDHIIGLYGTGQINLTDALSLYGIVGASQVRATTGSIPSIPELSKTDDKSSPSYGVGVDFGIGKYTAINFEYMRYLDKDTFTLDAISVGARYRF